MAWFRRLALAGLAWAAVAGAAFAQTAIPGLYLSGTPPTGFTSQSLMFHCTVPGTCPGSNAWPLVELYNSGGLNSLTNPIFISPATGSVWWQATQPVSIASMPTTPVTGTFWQTTQPVSAASLPLPHWSLHCGQSGSTARARLDHERADW